MRLWFRVPLEIPIWDFKLEEIHDASTLGSQRIWQVIQWKWVSDPVYVWDPNLGSQRFRIQRMASVWLESRAL